MTGFAPTGVITRRTLLLAGAGAAAAAAIPDVAMAVKERAGTLSHLDRTTWEPLVGGVIEVRDTGSPRVPLTLLKVQDIPTFYKQSDRFRQQSFYVVLRGPGTRLSDDTHLLKVPGTRGRVEVWFSHARLTDEGWEYVAVFANTKLVERPREKPRVKGTKKQRRKSGRKARPRRTEREPRALPPAEEPPAQPAPAPPPAAPNESFGSNG